MRGEREGEEMIERGESYERTRELLLLLLLLLSCLSFFRLLRVSRKKVAGLRTEIAQSWFSMGM